MASLRSLVFAPFLGPHIITQRSGPLPPGSSSSTSSRHLPSTPLLPQEALPDYTASSERPPTYTPAAPRAARQTYRLRQFGRNNQSFVPLGDFSSTVFSLQTKSFSSFLPSRPDMVFASMTPSSSSGSSSSGMSSKSKSHRSNNNEQTILAKASFARSGELPWQPRASITLSTVLSPSEDVIPMALDRKTSSRWSTTLGGSLHHWYLCLQPFRLVLMKDDGSSALADAVAVFTYGLQGTYASGGEAVGELSIIGLERSRGRDRDSTGGLAEEEERENAQRTRYLVEIMLSCGIVIAHWRNQGKVFYNE